MPRFDEASESEFERLLRWAFKGEIFGEELFGTLQAAYPDHADELSTLAALERNMARALVDVLARHGISHGDAERSRTAGQAAAEAIGSTAWHQFIAEFDSATTDALTNYHRLRDIAPGPDMPAIELLIAHEKALQAFAAAHNAGRGENALDEVRSVLTALDKATAP